MIFIIRILNFLSVQSWTYLGLNTINECYSRLRYLCKSVSVVALATLLRFIKSFSIFFFVFSLRPCNKHSSQLSRIFAKNKLTTLHKHFNAQPKAHLSEKHFCGSHISLITFIQIQNK